jgi:conjugative transposon TraN protein
MKRIFYIVFLLPLISFGQQPQRISLSLNKTIHLFFPTTVVYNDVGSADVLIAGSDYILKLAAAIENFKETNLTVITKDNICYSFILDYSPDVTTLNYYIDKSTGKALQPADSAKIVSDISKPKVIELTNLSKNSIQDSLSSLCLKSISKPFSYWDEGMYYKKLYLALNNIFVSGNKLFFIVSVGNMSNINYDIDYFKLTVKNKKNVEASSIQEIEKLPVFSYKKPETIQGSTKLQSFVLVFEKFTIPAERKLVFEMGEKNGGRTISYSVKQDLIIDALVIN